MHVSHTSYRTIPPSSPHRLRHRAAYYTRSLSTSPPRCIIIHERHFMFIHSTTVPITRWRNSRGIYLCISHIYNLTCASIRFYGTRPGTGSGLGHGTRFSRRFMAMILLALPRREGWFCYNRRNEPRRAKMAPRNGVASWRTSSHIENGKEASPGFYRIHIINQPHPRPSRDVRRILNGGAPYHSGKRVNKTERSRPHRPTWSFVLQTLTH